MDATSDPKLKVELAEYLKSHADDGRSYHDIEQEFWRFRTGKLLESDLIAPPAGERDVCPVCHTVHWQYKCPNPAPAEQSAGVERKETCPHCGVYTSLHYGHCNNCEKWVRDDISPVTLQLLVIDLGDCCVVKVEKGVRQVSEHDEGWKPDYMFQVGGTPFGVDVGRSVLMDSPFAEIRAAIDALEQKPVPDKDSAYAVLSGLGGSFVLAGLNEQERQTVAKVIKMLSDKPRSGEWKQLLGQPYEPLMKELIPLRGISASTVISEMAEPIRNLVQDLTNEVNSIHGQIPVAIWRFTLK